VEGGLRALPIISVVSSTAMATCLRVGMTKRTSMVENTHVTELH